MALQDSTYQFVQQLGPLTLVDATTGPEGPTGVTASYLIGANGWHNGVRLPHEVDGDLKAQNYEKRIIEGIEYYLVPREASNLPGRLSHYAQTTGVADLQNPPGGGVNPLREQVKDSAYNTNDPHGVAKFVEDAEEAWEEAKQVKDAENAIVNRAVQEGPIRLATDGSLGDPNAVKDAPAADATDEDA